MKISIITGAFLLFLVPVKLKAQEDGPGNFSLGIRSTLSTFSHAGNTGQGFGGQFRLQLLDRLNTEWFADCLVTELESAGRRNDAHIGWSVMFYLTDPVKRITPYLVGGHCFDLTTIHLYDHGPMDVAQFPVSAKKFSSAVQLGGGAKIQLNKQFDISLSSQYMSHLGKDLHIKHTGDPAIHQNHYSIENTDVGVLEGHLLITASFNLKIADLW